MIEQTIERVEGWFQANRKGEQGNLPCYWSLYPATNPTSAPNKNTSPLCSNLTISDPLESAVYLVERMNDNPYYKYYSVRLRTKQGDTGVMNNFANPHYQSQSKAGIGNSSPSNDMNVFMIGMLNEQMQYRLQQKEEQTNIRLQQIEERQKLELERLKLEYETKEQIRQLKEENEALKYQEPPSFVKDVWNDIKHEVMGVIKLMAGTTGTKQDLPSSIEGKPTTDDELLNTALESLNQTTSNTPAMLFKLATVLQNSTPEQGQMLINLLESNYSNIVQQQRQNGSQSDS